MSIVLERRKQAMGVVFGGFIIFCFAMMVYKKIYHDKQLILDNPILTIPTQASSKAVIISTFGVLSEHKCYRWGYKGSKLMSVVLDKERIFLSFGNDEQVKHIDFYHRLGDKYELNEVSQKFLDETGVVVNVKIDLRQGDEISEK